ncbi:DNA-binding protein [Pararobbsia alpina]|uniref:hypothetical protein n=1 Tax=Pararobbsia alpina TaxID=621374 RepID=UPI0039A7655C
MSGAVSAEEFVSYTVRLRDKLMHYATMDAWTPIMGALLLGGIEPPIGCTTIPAGPMVGLDGEPSHEKWEARKILEEWKGWCADRDQYPETITPADFIAWCVDEGIKERFSVHSAFIWIGAFNDLFGYTEVRTIPFEVALYASKMAEPIQTILARLDELDHGARPPPPHDHVTGREKANVNKPNAIAEARGYLLTEEFAAALSVLPTTIHKSWTRNGHYGGVRPEKLPSGRLKWPLDAVDRALKVVNNKQD